MDRQQLNTALRRFFDAYEFARYQGVVLTVSSERELRQLQSQLEALLLDREIWRLPGDDGSPIIPCPRRIFNEIVLSKRNRGLVIIDPLAWLFDWPVQEQAVFWTGVADLYGRHSVLITAVETPPLVKQLRLNFNRYPLFGMSISVWLSNHQRINGLEEVLL